MLELNKAKKIHFIGIGGVGISAIAKMMLSENKEVVGSDASDSIITDKLKNAGAEIFIGHKASNLANDTDLVVYTIAIKDTNPELKKAKRLKIKTLTYPQALGLISKDKYTIAISGTHGKTTVTGMLEKVLTGVKLSPTVIIGSLLDKNRGNFVAGKSKYFLTEACEYRESFLNLFPNILAITNIDNDHLDYFKDIEHIKRTFKKMVGRVPKDGFIVCNLADKNIKDVVKDAKAKVVDYGKLNGNLKLKVPGKHNIENAKVALAVAKILKINHVAVENFLEKFSGTWRRTELKGKNKKGFIIYDDYAHHPTEVKATLSGFRERFPKKKIIVVFQPHLYSRTKSLMEQFAKSFQDADEVIITDIYAAREKKDKSVHSRDLVDAIKNFNPNVSYMKEFRNIKKYLIKEMPKNALVVTMGAGDISKLGDTLI